MSQLHTLLERLTPDRGRESAGFSREMEEANLELIAPSKSDAELASVLAAWLTRHQPCLFGRMAAGVGDLITYCVLTEADILQGDSYVRDKIQRHRLHWHRQAFLGTKSAFVIFAVSRRLIWALPNEELKEFAIRLCSLYLREEIVPNRVFHDRITLEIPALLSPDREAGWYEWRVGVNFFAAAGDKRWWHDHRIPGGIAFSMNSVGHMARSGALQNMVAGASGTQQPTKGKLGIDSLGTALKFAMLTINNAQDTISGKATCLRGVTTEEYATLQPKCPFSPPPQLILKDYSTYRGWYDTDATVPSDYFHPDVARPSFVEEKELDFTYLFDDSVDNPSYETMGEGAKVR